MSPAVQCLLPPLSGLALSGLQQHDVINLPGLFTFIFQPLAPKPQGLYPLGLLDTANFTVTDNLDIVLSTPFDHEPICMLHPFPDDLRCNGPTEPETTPHYAGGPDPFILYTLTLVVQSCWVVQSVVGKFFSSATLGTCEST